MHVMSAPIGHACCLFNFDNLFLLLLNHFFDFVTVSFCTLVIMNGSRNRAESHGLLSGGHSQKRTQRTQYRELHNWDKLRCQTESHGRYYYSVCDMNLDIRKPTTRIIVHQQLHLSPIDHCKDDNVKINDDQRVVSHSKSVLSDHTSPIDHLDHKFSQSKPVPVNPPLNQKNTIVHGMDDDDEDDLKRSQPRYEPHHVQPKAPLMPHNMTYTNVDNWKPQLLWNQLVASTESQYTYDSTASCTIMALECAMLFQLEHKNYINTIVPDKRKIAQILKVASMYKSDKHTDVLDIMPNISRYTNHLKREREHQILVPNWNDLSKFLIQTGKELRSEISCVVTKPPETIFIHFHFPLLGVDGRFDITQPMLFDSHTRTERDIFGAHILRFEDIVSFETYLKLLWPEIPMGDNPTMYENQVNTVNIDVITLDPNLRKKPLLNVNQLQGEFDALSSKMNQSYNQRESYSYHGDYSDQTVVIPTQSNKPLMPGDIGDVHHNGEQDDGFMIVGADAVYDEILQEKDKTIKLKDKTIKEKEKAIVTLKSFVKKKSMELKEAQETIKTVQNKKLLLLNEQTSNQNDEAQVHMLQKQLLEANSMEDDLRSIMEMEKEQWITQETAKFNEEHQNMLIDQELEIHKINDEKNKVIAALKQERDNLLAELKPYRDEKRRIAELNRTYTCPICMDEFKVQEDAFLMDCDHILNTECARRTFNADVTDHKRLPQCPKCLAENITTWVTPQQLEWVLDQQTMRFYHDLCIQVALRQEKCFFCPTADCKFFATITDDVEVFSCNTCGHAYCTKCKRAYHRNETCKEYKDRKCKEETMNEEQLAKLAEEQGWHQCPGCETYIERTFGCFHMKCKNPACGAEFCDGCGAMLDKKNWRAHFNPPNKCKLWAHADDLINPEQKSDD
eukprot:787543_1